MSIAGILNLLNWEKGGGVDIINDDLRHSLQIQIQCHCSREEMVILLRAMTIATINRGQYQWQQVRPWHLSRTGTASGLISTSFANNNQLLIQQGM